MPNKFQIISGYLILIFILMVIDLILHNFLDNKIVGRFWPVLVPNKFQISGYLILIFILMVIDLILHNFLDNKIVGRFWPVLVPYKIQIVSGYLILIFILMVFDLILNNFCITVVERFLIGTDINKIISWYCGTIDKRD